MKKKIWESEEIDYLLKNYETGLVVDIKKRFSYRSWDSVKQKANHLGIYRSPENYIELRKSDLRSLLENTPEAFYWIGFILGDGYINHSVWRLNLELAKKDVEHVRRFALFVKSGMKEKALSFYVNAQDKELIPKIVEKFSIPPQKTFYPPDIKWIQEKLFWPLVIGLIDADGCIRNQHKRKDCILTLKLHKSWLPVLSHIHERIVARTIQIPGPKINNFGYARMNISNSVVLRFLKNQAKFLPMLSRKWDKIDESFVGEQERGKINLKKARELHKKGFLKKEIAAIMKLGVPAIYQMEKRHGL